MMDKSCKTLVLGAYGRIGTPLVNLLEKSGYTNLLFPTRNACNMLDSYSYEWYFSDNEPEYVLNLIGKTTSIKMCADCPASIARDTLRINTNVLDVCSKYKVKKLVNVICSCSYPGDKDVLVEHEFWEGSPHESIRSHGESKRMVYYLGQAYAQQYKMNVVTIALNNVFGHHDWSKNVSPKFLDSIIKKIVQTKLYKQKEIELWGSGVARRESIYYRDAAEGVLKVFENYNSSELINVGTGYDYSIKEWATIVAATLKYKGDIVWRTEMPDGQLKKLFSIEKQLSVLEQWVPPTRLEDAIKETAASYKEFLASSL